jgi:Lipopolysaccharide-assembly, LptC-related
MRLTDHGNSRFACLVLLALTGAVCMAAPETTPPASATNPAAKGERIDLPVPVGEPVKGIKIPQYDETGKLTMSLSADTARKLDEKKVELGQLKVEFHDKDEKEIVVEIPHSMLDLETKVLSADSETRIQREDFEITGKTAEFDTASRSGTFKGRVRASFQNGEHAQLP